MLDAVDRVIRLHIQKQLSVNGKPIPVFSTATADQDDQPFTQAGLKEKVPDRVTMPFVSLIRLPTIEYTDYNMTKRIHNYEFFESSFSGVQVTYDRCSLSYVATIFAENRKVSEDLATALYSRLRCNCQVHINIILPLKVDESDSTVKTHFAAEMDSDIVMEPTIEQVNQQQRDRPQLYKARVSFKLNNVNIYNFTEPKEYSFGVYLFSRTEDQSKWSKEPIPGLSDSSG